MNEKRKKLNQLSSTAICGNDISSSVLYVSALSIAFAGQYAWITLLIVSLVLFLFRKIYGEVVGALPLNGGAYNALLNTTSKSTAGLFSGIYRSLKTDPFPMRSSWDLRPPCSGFPGSRVQQILWRNSNKVITQLSEEWKIPINFMFIGSPGDKFPYKIEDLGGVRLII